LLTLCGAVSPAYAQSRARVVIEVDAAGERLLDARAVRRLVALELSDVAVPEELDGAAPTLFYRVLGDNRGFVDLELWERGTLHGSRRVSSADRAGHLFARRVALAAAELARAVRQQRIAKRRVEARRVARERAERRLRLTQTLEGPLAVRTGVFVARGDALTVFGSNLTLGITLVGATRLDLGARISGAELGDADARWTALEVELGPAHRFRLSSGLDLDLSALLGASALHVTGVRGVDAISEQDETWTARAALSLRLEPRLNRWMRASFGLEGGQYLRAVPLETRTGATERLRSPYAGVGFGLVLTPPRE
jgi:hypothetical protein